MVENQIPVRRRIQPIVAWRAMQALLRDKDDTGQVFRIIRALGGHELTRNFRRFAASEVGARIIRERRELLSALANQQAIMAMPEGSLGHAYMTFVGAENLTPDGLVDASLEGGDTGESFTDDENIFRRRIRDMHDLWHVVNGYGRDEIGELSLLAFTYSQLRNRGLRFILWMGQRHSIKGLPGMPVKQAIKEGFRNGREAQWLAAVDWEAMLPLPIEDVRAAIGYRRPVAYEQAVATLRAAGIDGYQVNPLAPLPKAA